MHNVENKEATIIKNKSICGFIQRLQDSSSTIIIILINVSIRFEVWQCRNSRLSLCFLDILCNSQLFKTFSWSFSSFYQLSNVKFVLFSSSYVYNYTLYKLPYAWNNIMLSYLCKDNGIWIKRF